MTPSNSANGAMLSPSATEIGTVSGGFVDVAKPDPQSIELADIAGGLSKICRYNGQIKRFYSVAEHAVLVHDLMEHLGDVQGCLAGALFHDAAEAYLGDVVAPLKYALRQAEFDYPGAAHRAGRLDDFEGAYAQLTSRMERAIADRFDLTVETFEGGRLAVADMWALRIEADKLTPTGGENWRWPGELPNDGKLPAAVNWFGGMQPAIAERLWLKRVSDYVETDLVR